MENSFFIWQGSNPIYVSEPRDLKGLVVEGEVLEAIEKLIGIGREEAFIKGYREGYEDGEHEIPEQY